MAAAGRKDDEQKLRYDLVPLPALEIIVQAITHGAKKYGDENWRQVPHWRRRYFAALCRHLFAFMRGERIDNDSGVHHLGCAGACLFFLAARDLAGDKDE